MKKKIFGGIAVLAIVVMAAWNVSLGLKANGISNVKLAKGEALANMEALSDDESNQPKGYPTPTQITTYIYDDQGRLIETRVINVICCYSGDVICTPHSAC